jgi:O-antigen/teichoic acid export membrane protein
MPITFINKLVYQIPIIFIASMFGTSIVGYYGLAYSITKLPSQLIGLSIGNVFYAEAARVGRKNPKIIKELANKIVVRLFFVGLVPFIVIVVGGPYLFSLVFGNQWLMSGIYARLISIMILSHLVLSPVSRVFEVYEKQKISFILNIIKLILIIAVFGVINYLSLDAYVSILTYSVTMSLISFITFIIAQNVLKSEVLRLNR